MKRLTRLERENGVGYKALLIAKNRQGQIVRMTSPQALTPWEHDGATWTLRAHKLPESENRAGVYVAFSLREARKYRGTLCKVILSGTVVIHDEGARGEFARVLEVEG